jgi:hypothetical protein
VSDDNTDYKERLDLSRVMTEPGEWSTTKNSRNNIVKTAIFDSFFNYLTLRADDAIMQLDYEIGPERILNEMMKKTELEIMRSLSGFKVADTEDDE